MWLSRSSMYMGLSGAEEDMEMFYTSVLSDSKNWVLLKFIGYANVLLVKSVLSFLVSQAVSGFVVVSILFRAAFCFVIYLVYWNRKKVLFSSLARFRIVTYLTMIIGMLIPAIEAFSLKGSEEIAGGELTMIGFLRIQSAEVVFVFILFSAFPCIEFRANLLMFAVNLVCWIAITARHQGFIEIFYFILVVCVAHLIYHYLLIKLQIKNFNSLKRLQKKAKEQNHILANLLPKHVRRRRGGKPQGVCGHEHNE